MLIIIVLESDLTRKHAVLNRHVRINVISITRDDARRVRACVSVGKGVKTKSPVMLSYKQI